MTTKNTSQNDTTNEQLDADLDNPSRRTFFKRAAVGGGAALVAGLGSYAAGKGSVQGQEDPDWPEVTDDFKPFAQRDTVWSYALSPLMMMKHPERNEQFGRLNKDNPRYNFQLQVPGFEQKDWDNTRPGFTQLDTALQHSAWLPPYASELRLGACGTPNTRLFTWDQSDVEHEQYQFGSEKEASDAIRSAARLYGAVRCGIARRDKRWDYDPIYDAGVTTEMMDMMAKEGIGKIRDQKVLAGAMKDAMEHYKVQDRELSWEHDFPFEPKTVIVMAVPMDYDNVAAAPTRTSCATVGDGYTKMATLASSIAKFIKGLGFQAVACGNDLGNSVAYGIAAGLGEGGRNNQLLVPGYGPRVRLCKVYTDFDFVQYDVPHSWGITEFCKSCKKCGEACPSGAIDMADDTHFYFEGEHSEQPGYSWSNHEGIKKFHTDAKKCFDYWLESDTDCAACTASCTFNEPDYWHHWFIMAINPYTPRLIHSLMAELHPAFGYGSTQNPEKVKKFWKTGEGMRVNETNRNVFGAVGKA
ncbi:reductive dehalogenase [Photobacterium sp. SDRW27]|uniref:reductive dehalogenase n=1 Tax=Photobacterium obscurum TaxID=2829490 RepID=UPI002242EEC8|nr:reductive dehalogenase [Photobacterium obscurum]MCW8329144.1 reductive dehalogenase [Photobacterium obscurum]